MRLTSTFLLLAVVIEVCAGLSCLPCERKWCQRHELRCVGNLVKDSCGCCYECAKQINETCGGLWNYEGTCDVGLKCQYSSSFPPGMCTRKVQCHVHGGANYGQWIDVGQTFTMRECSNGRAAEICVCQDDGTVDCKKSKEC